MPQLASSRIFGALRGMFSALDQPDDDLLRNSFLRPKTQTTVSDGGVAATAQTETWVFQNTSGTNMRVVRVAFAAPVAAVADPANNATITLTRRDAAGINPVTVATNTTTAGGTGSLVAFLPVVLPLTAANVIIPINGQLTVQVTKAGTGVILASATAQARIEVLLEPAD